MASDVNMFMFSLISLVHVVPIRDFAHFTDGSPILMCPIRDSALFTDGVAGYLFQRCAFAVEQVACVLDDDLSYSAVDGFERIGQLWNHSVCNSSFCLE